MLHKFLTITAATVLLGATLNPAFAEEGGGIDISSANNPAQALATARAPEVAYYDMTPDFTTNLANTGSGRMHYLRVHVNIMVKDSADMPLLTEHDPLIRDAILSIIGSKEYNAIATAAGREALRAECRARVAELLSAKKNGPVVQDSGTRPVIHQLRLSIAQACLIAYRRSA